MCVGVSVCVYAVIEETTHTLVRFKLSRFLQGGTTGINATKSTCLKTDQNLGGQGNATVLFVCVPFHHVAGFTMQQEY